MFARSLYRLGAFLTVFILSASTALAQQEDGFDEILSGFLAPVADNLASLVFYEFDWNGAPIMPIVIWMALPMIILTIYFGFINLRSFHLAWDVIRGRFWDEKAPGEVSQFKALTTALSGTVGIGNIAGVGLAIGTGGPGATFWMIIIGLAAMSVKFAECTLGVKYRVVHEDGTVSGGPMYYLRAGLANRGYAKLGIALSLIYAMFGVPTILQWATVNQMYAQTSTVTGFEHAWIFGVILAILVGMVIIGGIKSIANVTSRLVPLMVFIYLAAAFTVIAMNITAVPAAFLTIFEHAFNPQAVGGGIIGVIIIGMRRAVYSTEAGLGTSSMAHAAAKTNEPVSEGMVGLMEPFIDTVLVSTITALVIIISGAWATTDNVAVDLTSAAFETDLAWFPYVLAIAVFLFGYSTIISWGYYTEKIWTFLIGESKQSKMLFRVGFCILLVPGAVLTATQVFDIIDSLFFMLAVPNVIGLYIMAPEIRKDMKDYIARLKSGEIRQTQPAE